MIVSQPSWSLPRRHRRRVSLRCILPLFGAVGLATGGGASVVRAEPITLTFSHFLGPASFFQVDVVEPWARAVERDTKGKVRVRIVNNTDPLGDVNAQAANVKTGSVDIALGIRGAEGALFPGTSVVEVPLAVRDATRGSRALWRLVQDGSLAKEYMDYKVLAVFVQNPGLIHTVNTPVAVPDDIRGMRLRAPNPATASVLTTLGAKPLILQVNEVMPALDAGKLDGIITNWGNPLPSFDTKVRYHTDVRFYTAAFFIVMNRARYDALPASVRRVIDRRSGLPLVERIGRLWNKWDAEVRDRSLARGQAIYSPKPEEKAAWNAALGPAVQIYLDQLTGQYPAAKQTYIRFLQYQSGAAAP